MVRMVLSSQAVRMDILLMLFKVCSLSGVLSELEKVGRHFFGIFKILCLGLFASAPGRFEISKDETRPLDYRTRDTAG